MRIINKKYLLIILLVGVILTGVIIFKPKEEVRLDNVILKQEVNNKIFAMYKEEGNEYVPVNDNKFPDMYVLNLTKSKCIDNNGNELEDVLSYENDKVVLTTNKSSYCYLYFDKSLGLEIKEKKPNKLSTDQIRGAMYRFQGQAKDENGNELVNNYICFGTSDKEECVKDKDHHMYRIIGIEASTGRVKVIKKDALNSAVPWWDNHIDDREFPKSKIYETISGTDFLKNTDYIPAGWGEKIAQTTWIYGDMPSNTIGAIQKVEEIYLVETGQIEKNKTFESKVSLMYIHDYYYSVNDTTTCRGDDLTECENGWLNLSSNNISAPSVHEWTMSRNGNPSGGMFEAFRIDGTGFIGSCRFDANSSIRPVFYLASVNQLSGGTGTIEEPFIIKE